MVAPAESYPKLTFEEYLEYQDDSDLLHELHRGFLELMISPTGRHIAICEFLVGILQRHIAARGLPLTVKTPVGVRTEVATSRIPDVVVCRRELWEKLRERPGAGVFNFGETPILVVEVVSEDRRRDLVTKRGEYAIAGVAEYWIVDGAKQRILVCTEPENEEGYRCTEFLRAQKIISGQFPELALTVEDILAAPAVDDLVLAEQQQLTSAEQRTTEAEQRATKAEQRLAQLSAYLRAQGIDPDSI